MMTVSPWGPSQNSLLAGDTTYNGMGAYPPAVETSPTASLFFAPPAPPPPANSPPSTTGVALGYAGLATSVIGAIGGYFASKNQAASLKSSLEFQSDMAKINQRIAEGQAQSILAQGQQQIARQTLQAGQVKSRQRAAMAANGIDIGEGSAAEVTATTDLIKEIDSNQINANAVRAAWGMRTQSVNYGNQSLLQGASAQSINPSAAGVSSLIGSAGGVASSWYQLDKRIK